MNKLAIVTAIACTFSLAPVNNALAKEKVKKDKVIHVCSKKDNSTTALACNIYKEARGESLRGQLAVGFVTINRQWSDNFPHTIKGVVYQNKQFSWANSGRNMKVRDRKAWEEAKNVANFLQLMKKMPATYYMLDFTNGSTYYHSIDVHPYWTKVMEMTVRIDNHIFYKEDRKDA